MVATVMDFHLDVPKTEDDVRLAKEFFKTHEPNPSYAQAAFWKVVRDDDGRALVNAGIVVGAGPSIVITDLYCDPSRRGVEAVKWFLRGIKAAVDAGTFAQIITPRASRKASRWWKEVFENEPYLIHFYNGGRYN